MFYKPNPSKEETLDFVKKLLDDNSVLNVTYNANDNCIEINLKSNQFQMFYDGR